jgi:hypothetical protein
MSTDLHDAPVAETDRAVDDLFEGEAPASARRQLAVWVQVVLCVVVAAVLLAAVTTLVTMLARGFVDGPVPPILQGLTAL